MIFSREANQEQYPFVLPALPYSLDALAPHLSQKTFEYHYYKHHQAYVNNLNRLVENSNLLNTSLELIIAESHKKHELQSVFNNAAQIWNHTFYWYSMSKDGGGKPQGELLVAIERDFGSFANFTNEFSKAAGHFGSGWVWLVKDARGKLHILSTSNAEVPITDRYQPLVTCDIWEHAYYIDFYNERPKYVSIFLEHLINWRFAEDNYQRSF